MLQVSTEEHPLMPHLMVVTAQGDIDLSTVVKMREVIEQVAGDGQPLVHGQSGNWQAASEATPGQAGVIAIDLREVAFIDSAGLALLVEVRKRFGGNHRVALVIERGSQPERVLQLGHFASFLTICYALEELPQALHGDAGAASQRKIYA